MITRFQNRIGASRLSLPIMTMVVISQWAVLLFTDPYLWPSFVIFAINTYMMVELNNRNALMRQYSRMVSCSYMALTMMCQWLVHDAEAMAVQFCFIASLSTIFHTYQNRAGLGYVFWAFLFLGMGIAVWPPLVFVVPLFWIGETFYLMSFSLRAFWASILGLLTPFWLIAPLLFYVDRLDMVVERVEMLNPALTLEQIQQNPYLLLATDYTMPVVQTVCLVFVSLMMVTGMFHYFRQSYADKIHVRMLYQFMTLCAVATFVVMVAVCVLYINNVPSLDMLLSLLIVTTSPLIGHYVAYSSTRLTNISVMAILLLALLLTLYHLLAGAGYVDAEEIKILLGL